MKSRYFKKSLSNDQRGVFLPLFLLILFAIVAVLGLAVDLASFYKAQIRLQRAVDAAALAAAKMQNQPVAGDADLENLRAQVQAAALEVARANLAESGFTDTQIIGDPTVEVQMADIRPPGGSQTPRGSYTLVTARIKPPLLVLDMLPFFRSHTIISASAEAEARSAIISMVLDVSGSMDSYMPPPYNDIKKIDALKQAATAFVNDLGTGRDVVALNTFSSLARSVVNPNDYFANPAEIEAHRERLRDEIADLEAEGRTNASEALFYGYRSIKDKKDSLPLPCYVIFFTDGAPNISTANWVPSPAGNFYNNADAQNPATSMPPPPDWHAYHDQTGSALNNWYRTYGGYNTNDTRMEDFCPGPSPCAGIDEGLLRDNLGMNQTISFRVPGRYSSNNIDGRLYSLFSFTDPNGDTVKMRRLHYITAMAISDYIRAKQCTIFSIGLGQRETDFTTFYQTILDDTLPRKDYFLSRVANDPNCGGTDYIDSCLDEPDGYVESYEELRANNALRGDYYPTDNPADLTSKFREVLANIRLRLNK